MAYKTKHTEDDFGKHLIGVKANSFFVNGTFFENMTSVPSYDAHDKPVVFFVDEVNQVIYNAYSLEDGSYKVLKKASKDIVNFLAHLNSEHKALLEPPTEKEPETVLEARIREFYDTDGAIDKEDWGENFDL